MLTKKNSIDTDFSQEKRRSFSVLGKPQRCRVCQRTTTLFLPNNGLSIHVKKCDTCGLFFVTDLYSGVILKTLGVNGLDSIFSILKEIENNGNPNL